MNFIIVSIIVLAAAGLLCGLALALAARFFSVEEDPKIAKVTEALPGANCGGCGFPGCAGYAAAVVAGKAPTNKCAPGGSSVSRSIASILGLKSFESDAAPKVAVVMCGGDSSSAVTTFQYNGITDCAAAAAVAGGDKACKYGCLGYGTCVRSCPAGAIQIENGIASVRADLCIGCGKCASLCPRGVIRLVPQSHTVHVFCNSRDKGADVRKCCSKGCIGCRICTKNVPENSVLVEDNLARVNYDLAPLPPDAGAKCPAKCFRSAK